MDRIYCEENDTRLVGCARYDLIPGMVGDHCTHSKDAGVICRGKHYDRSSMASLFDISSGSSNCSDGEIRLVGGPSQSKGIVEICFGDLWGTICDDDWDDNDTRVVCRQLGYHQGHGMY